MASVKKNYVYNLIAQVLAIILPIVTTPYVTRVLGNENLGIFNYAQSIVNYFVLFGCIGLNTYSQRQVAFYKGDRQKQSQVFWEVLLIRVVSLTASIVLYGIFIVRTADYPLCYAIFGLELLAALVDVSWFLQGNEDFRNNTIRAIITRLLGLVCIFLFVKNETHLNIYILCCAGAILVGNLSLLPFLRKFLCRVPWKELRPLKHLKPALILFLPQVAINVYTQLDKTMIGVLTGYNYDQVGYYSQAEKIVKLAMTIVTSIGGVMLSRVTVALAHNDQAGAKEYINKSFRFLFLLGWPIAVGLAVAAPDMVPWFFGPGYDAVVPCMVALSPLVLIVGTSNVMGVQYMIPAKRMTEYTISILCGLCVNVLLNVLLIPRLGAMGAVAATLAAETVVTLKQYHSLRNVFRPTIFLQGTKNMAAAAVMGVVVYAISVILPSTLWATVLEVGTGAMIYFAALLLLRDEFFVENIKRAIKRGK